MQANGILDRLRHQFNDLGYGVSRQSLMAAEMLHVTVEDSNHFEPFIVAVSLFPKEEKDDPTLIHFFSQFDFTVVKDKYDAVCREIIARNSLLAIGGFGISEDKKTVVFTYVLATGPDGRVDDGAIDAVMDNFIYAVVSFGPGLREAAGAG